MLDEQKMLQMIASEPLIRTVVLADRLDCDIEEVEDALLPMINRGRIVAQPVMGPNNRRATGYSLSDESRGEILRESKGVSIDACASHIERAIPFIKEHNTVTGAQLHAFLGLEATVTPSQVLAEAMADGRLFKDGKHWTLGTASRCAPIDAPVAPRTPPPAEVGTKVDRAVAFVKTNGSATDEELRRVMGIERPTAPAAYLGAAIRNGKLHKSAGKWKPGPAASGGVKEGFSFAKDSGPVAAFGPEVQPEEAADLPDVLVAELSKPAQALAVTPVPIVAEAAPFDASKLKPVGTQPLEKIEQLPPVASFRCGLWSDGVLEICRDGKVIAALSPDERTQVAEFLAKAA